MKHLKIFILFCVLSVTFSCGQQKTYITYKVQEGETIRSIARDNDMATKDLLKLNPNIARRPKPNTIIKLPADKANKKRILTEKVADSDEKIDTVTTTVAELTKALVKLRYKTHEVKKGETFYSLTRFYNVSKDSLLALNPELTAGLKAGATIKISYIKPVEIVAPEEIEEDDTVLYQDAVEEDIVLKAALMLPFKAVDLDTLTPQEIFDNSRLANIVTDFYLGAQLAIDSLDRKGINVSLSVYDTGDRNSSINELLSEKELNSYDVILGPIYSSEAVQVANEVSVPVVFPVFSRNQSEFSSSKLVKMQPDYSVYKNTILAHLMKVYEGQHIVIVSDSLNDSQSVIASLQNHDSISEVTLVTPKNGYLEKKDLINAMKSNVSNWIIVDTKDNVLAANAVNSLIALPTREEVAKAIEDEEELGMQAMGDSTLVQLYTFEKGATFDKIDNNKLARLDFTYATDVYAKNESTPVKSFNASYFKRNNSLPSYYATKGFDITYDILMRLASGKKLKSTFDDGVSYRLESKFDYRSGFFRATDNNGVFIIQYNKDLTLRRLK